MGTTIDTSLTDIDFTSLDNYINPEGYTDATISFKDGWGIFESKGVIGNVLASKKLNKIKPSTKYTLVFQVAEKEINPQGDGLLYLNRTQEQVVFKGETIINLKDFETPGEKRYLLESHPVIESYHVGLHIQTLSWEINKFRFRWYLLEGDQVEVKPQPPTPEGGGDNGQTDNSSCSNTGQFGGGGTPLKDIKLFLYANKVTKGTIKLSKPQVEVGTFATDWRPNPSDYVERHSPAYKEVKGIAIQHNQSQNKKYLEIETADGYAYGVDLWGGDTKKLLEQQQKEIEELKKIVQTLELRINV